VAPTKQTKAAKTSVKKAQKTASSKKPPASGPAKAKTALSKQGTAVAKRAGGAAQKTRAELYELAKKRDLPGRSKMSRDELARKLGLGGRSGKSPGGRKSLSGRKATKRGVPQTGTIRTDTMAPH